ncbi:MAG: hypothetical protein KBC95_02645 [Candidatus Peribacteraceae bacterium]|nr:hypothetical protein [Candidatus Peribacteraceae bacterium]
MSPIATHEFGIFSLGDECVVVIYKTGETPERLPQPPMPRTTVVPCPLEVEELMFGVDLHMPLYVCLSDVYAGIRAAMVSGWNEANRPLGRSVTVEEFADALRSHRPWEIQKSLKRFIDDSFPWVFRLGDEPASNDAVGWQDIQSLLSGCFQLAFVLGLAHIL